MEMTGTADSSSPQLPTHAAANQVRAAEPMTVSGPWLRFLPRAVRIWLEKRFGDVTPTIRRGYGLWLAVGVVIAIPELWAAAAKPPWPTISGTIGHLESRWDLVAVIVVAVIVVIAAHAVRMPLTDAGPLSQQADRRTLGRTTGGRFTLYPDDDRELSALGYLAASLACVIAGSVIASALSDNKWILGYVIYGLIGVFCVVIPSVLALTPAPNAPFSGVFPTIADLQRRLHFVALVLLTGLVILLIHLAFYPWPDVFRHHPAIDSP
jgi:hypothetical protein